MNLNLSNQRQVKGLEMANAIGSESQHGVAIQRLNKLTYRVRSQSSADKWYTVIKEEARNHWICDCPDYTFRLVKEDDKRCKHIHAVQFSKLLRTRIYHDQLIQNQKKDNIENAAKIGKIVCQKCSSENYVKCSIRHNKKAGDIQRYLCKDCGFRFIVNPGFENSKASAQTISEAIDLYFKGVSLRKIEDHFAHSRQVSISYGSVCRWIRKFNRIVKPYVDSLVPSNVGGVYQVDEMLLHVRKENNEMNMTVENKENHTNRKFDNHYSWLWNLMDSSSRFWICSRITQKRIAEDAGLVFREMKDKAPMPKAVIHDGLRSYDEAYQKELYTHMHPRIQNIRSIGSNEKGLNPKVERLNGTVRDRETAMRGLDNAKTAQELVDAMRIHYNFLRPNQALGGQTPAEVAGINLNLGENKTESLIRQAAMKARERETGPLVKGLGIRANKVVILNEKDGIKVRAKTWLERKDWAEINDILRVQGFNWLSNGKDSCWMK